MTPSLLKTALACRCPRCGKGALFQGVLTVRPLCPVCGLDLQAQDTGDGPVALVILVLGSIIVAMAFWVEFHLEPPLWVHAVIWPIVTIPLALAMMRPLKAAFVAVHFRHMSNGS